MCFILSHVCKSTGLWWGQSRGLTSGGAVPEQGPQPHAEDSRDGVEGALSPFLHDGLLQGAYMLQYAEKDWLKLASTASLQVTGGICITSNPPSEGSGAAAGTCVGAHTEKRSAALVTPCLEISPCWFLPCALLSQGGIRQCQALSWERGSFPGLAPWQELGLGTGWGPRCSWLEGGGAVQRRGWLPAPHHIIRQLRTPSLLRLDRIAAA